MTRDGRHAYVMTDVLPYLTPGEGWEASRVVMWFCNHQPSFLTAPAPLPRDPDVDPPEGQDPIPPEFRAEFAKLDRRLEAMELQIEGLQWRLIEMIRDEVVPARWARSSAGDRSRRSDAVRQELDRLIGPREVTARTAALVVGTNSPVNFVDRPAFRDFARGLNPQIELPSASGVREEILAQADRFREGFTPVAAGGRYVCLMVDGSSMAKRKWLAVSVAGGEAFYFWRLLELADNTSEAITAALATVVRELHLKRFVVCAAVTDNASNEILAVKNLPGVTGYPLVRVPCMSHTLNLAVHDFFTDVFGKNVFETDLQAFYEVLRRGSRGDHFRGLSSPCRTRWLSFGALVERIVAEYDDALRLFGDSSHIAQRFRGYNFPELDACFRVVNALMTWTESKHSFLDAVWSAALEALGKLAALHSHGNSCAAHFQRAVCDRLFRTADVGQLLLGYLITERGLAWYRGLPPYPQPNGFCCSSVWSMIGEFLRFFVNLFDADCERFMRAFHVYLSRAVWPTHQPVVQFWNGLSACSPTCFSEEPASYQLIAEMALILMRMPCSEAEVERVFSRMRDIVGKRSLRIKRDLLESRLVLQMNGPTMTPDQLSALDDLEGRDDAGPGEGEMTPPVAGGSARPGFPVPLIVGPGRPR
jgi:hypothetical protein